MTSIESIITLARHYCMDNYDFWTKKYALEKSDLMYSDNDYNIFPRYNILNAILQGILMITKKEYDTFEKCKEELINIGRLSQDIFTDNQTNNIAINAISEEREKFVEYISELSENNICNVIPLPYIRKLNKTESKDVRKKLNSIWKFDGGYWEHSRDKNEIIFLMEQFITESDKNNIVDYLTKSGKIFYIVDEMENDYETECFELEGCEKVITNKNYDWIIYISHEMYMAFGGKILLDYLNNLFFDRRDKINKFIW